MDDLPMALAKRYPRQIPVTRLGRLAIRADMQGQGLGQLLLADAINRAKSAAEAVGSAGLFVDAKDEASSSFYQHFGFIVCNNQPLKLYLPIW
jgi:predicted GNAT family N-acyltransferase